MSMSISNAIGLLAGVLTTGSILPQVIKILKTKHTRDISLLMYIFLTLGVLLWLIYGLIINELPIILANGSSLLLSASVLILKAKNG